MKNLLPYRGDCFKVHQKAVDRKHQGELKERLLKLNPIVEAEFKVFLDKFKDNNLISLVPNASLSLSKEDLLSLYNYQSSVIIAVRESIRKLQIRTIISTCQNCTIDSANTLDHILPQSNFPEFVVNPKNLFPCCSTCNSYKLDAMKSANRQIFLNLYLDDLPQQQYLFVDVSKDEDEELDFRFYLQNIGNSIDSNLFSVIESHFAKLHLFERMKLKSIEYVSELENKIHIFRHQLKLEEIVNNLINATNDDRKAYGDNHWKCILELSLLNSPIFISKIEDTV